MSWNPFIDAANWTRDAITDLFNGEKANDFEEVRSDEDPTRAAEAEQARIQAMVTTGAASQINQSLINQALAEKKAKNTQLIILLGAGVAAYMLFAGGKPRRKKRK